MVRVGSQAPSVKKVMRVDSRGEWFPVYYTRQGPPSAHPALVLPGGPGLASIIPYWFFRRRAARDGLDIIMVEHRGVGFSRINARGETLTHSDMWVEKVIEDLVAVLDAQGVTSAFLAGSSYGSYLATAFAAEHPDRVEGLLLDSTLHSPEDIELERYSVRQVLLEADPVRGERIRGLIRSGQDERVLLDVLRAAYELVGYPLVDRLLKHQLQGKNDLVWRALAAYVKRDETLTGVPGFYEFSQAGAIGFRELNYGAHPDGKTLDPALSYSVLAGKFPPFEGHTRDLVAELKQFQFPVVLIIGSRDLRTPPAIAYRAASELPNVTVLEVEGGHGALETNSVLFERALAMLMRGQTSELELLRTEALPTKGYGSVLARALQTSTG